MYVLQTLLDKEVKLSKIRKVKDNKFKKKEMFHLII